MSGVFRLNARLASSTCQTPNSPVRLWEPRSRPWPPSPVSPIQLPGVRPAACTTASRIWAWSRVLRAV